MHPQHQVRTRERGSTLLLAAFGLVLLLAMGALAIDVATLYLARTEAQRAADAAALAGAAAFASSGCTSTGTCGGLQDQARTLAKAVGDQNEVFGQLANIANEDVIFPPPTDVRDPLIQVTVNRQVPTFLAGALQRFLGGASSSSKVVAKATAEAFNPHGSTAPFSTSCLKPWILPKDTYTIGQSLTLKPGGGGASTSYQKIKFSSGGGVGGNYQADIQSCDSQQIKVRDVVFTLPNGTLGTEPAVNNLINGPAPGQDTLSGGPPFAIMPGDNNPLVQNGVVTGGIPVTTSSSVVSVPLYQTCNDVDVSCQVVGFMQLFIDDVNGDTIHTHILNIAIPSSDDAKDEPTVGGGSSLIPIRLIQ